MAELFSSTDRPRVFGMPPGADFARSLVDELTAAFAGGDPTDLARVELIVNTRRFERRIRALFDEGPARLLPRIRLVSDIGRTAVLPGMPPAVAPLRRRLELAQLVRRLLDTAPDIAPRAAAFDLADSLAALFEEMHGEGVGFDALTDLDLTAHSDYWARSLDFLSLIDRYVLSPDGPAPQPEARQRAAVEALIAAWEAAPPEHPVVIAGSTGSRGPTALLMAAVARLPHGAVVLPGFDFDTPDEVWSRLTEPEACEDHPQYRFAAFLERLGEGRDLVAHWPSTVPSPDRNRVVSLALRPAPVTDQWRKDGQNLPDLTDAMAGVSLLEAPTERIEAQAIALILRDAAEAGRSAALVTTDRTLSRRVTAALARWNIEPDDSAGRPLDLSPPGQLLRLTAGLTGSDRSPADILAILKHPLVATGGAARGSHLLFTRELELALRAETTDQVRPDWLENWAQTRSEPELAPWAAWVSATLLAESTDSERPLTDLVTTHLALTEALCAGPETPGSGELWKEAAGREAHRIMAGLHTEADAGGSMRPTDYMTLVRSILQAGSVRDRDAPHPLISIWGTLEARGQGAEILILGGLNEGTWPEAPGQDPWLNRAMRRAAGLLSPEREIGLAAHDFQQAVAARTVILSRALRDADAGTVPSRWLNRLCNLLDGLPGKSGKEALLQMRRRGERWITLAQGVDTPPGPPVPAHRPAPRPPLAKRPRALFVTRIQKLIRDPYDIYARYILRLRPLDPLTRVADHRLRGILVHDILERFVADWDATPETARRDRLLDIARRKLEETVPQAVTRALWLARVEEFADWFIDTETGRRSVGTVALSEGTGSVRLEEHDFTLSAKADRIDRLSSGGLVIYDYKTGSPPTKSVMTHFDRQLLLEALIAEAGGFPDLPAETVLKVCHIGLGSSLVIREHSPTGDLSIADTRAWLGEICAAFARPERGYTARRAVEGVRFEGDYDHLARYGEWDDTSDPRPEDVG